MKLETRRHILTLKLRAYERAHAIWMNTSVFTEAGKVAKAEKDAARIEYEAARSDWEDARKESCHA